MERSVDKMTSQQTDLRKNDLRQNDKMTEWAQKKDLRQNNQQTIWAVHSWQNDQYT
jgi:hypothetical protein